MGHYLSDMLPDPCVVCLKCMAGVFPQSCVDAWSGYLKTCSCPQPDHCKVEDVEVYSTDDGCRWRRKVSRSV